jgi:hypothetical protein
MQYQTVLKNQTIQYSLKYHSQVFRFLSNTREGRKSDASDSLTPPSSIDQHMLGNELIHIMYSK